ncbi:alkaline ceramidase [Agrilus planipennis]|uniref:Alkaline ceramidase n=1 Tax=Agrilus planipennis TaxID=224129 RepID=A0A7F5R8A6_AGRPL|nr:alkaline ceramidase [Agrilus planipennis]
MWAPLQPGSSPVDWCEENYTVTLAVAEFVNTISNIVFLIFPPLLVPLFKNYSEKVNRYINVFWLLFIVVGLSSAYFHATLSLIGQLLDELSILWMFCIGYCLFFPRKYFPKFVQNNRKRFTKFCLVLTAIGSVLSFIHPAVNAFALMIFGVPTMGFLYYQIHRIKHNVRVYRLGILIFIAAYTLGVLYDFLIVEDYRPDKRAVLLYWPRNNFDWGIPYVVVKDY